MIVRLHNVKRNMRFFGREKMEGALTLLNAIIPEIERYIQSEIWFERFYTYDVGTFLHSENVAILSIILAEEMGYSGQELREIAIGGMLHDVGKWLIPKRILDKPSALNNEEYAIIKKHPEKGIQLLEPFGLPENVQMSIIQHHERLGGTGYPYRLKGKAIHPHAQLVAVADVFDALISDRPYRRGLSLERALKIIHDGKGHDFAPEMVDSIGKLLGAEPMKTVSKTGF